MKKFSLVLPIKINNSNFLGGHGVGDDLRRIKKILLPSFQKFLDMDSVDRFCIVGVEKELDMIKTELGNEFDDLRIEFLSEESVVPEIKDRTIFNHLTHGGPGHIIQQLIHKITK